MPPSAAPTHPVPGALLVPVQHLLLGVQARIVLQPYRLGHQPHEAIVYTDQLGGRQRHVEAQEVTTVPELALGVAQPLVQRIGTEGGDAIATHRLDSICTIRRRTPVSERGRVIGLFSSGTPP